MSSPHPTPNPRFAEFRALLAANTAWFQRWKGTFYRFQGIDYPAPTQILNGEGARRRGGRWNRPGLSTIYGSLSDVTALEECKANDRYYGVVTKSPRLLVAVDASLTATLDLTSTAVRRALNVTLEELDSEDWRKIQQQGFESVSQALGRAAAACSASGLLVNSAAVPQGVNLVIFPGNRSADRLKVVNEERLLTLGIKTRA